MICSNIWMSEIIFTALTISGIMVDGISLRQGDNKTGFQIGKQDFSDADLVILGAPNSQEYRNIAQRQPPEKNMSYPIWAI